MYYTKDPIIYFFKGISPSRYSLYGTLIKYLLEKCSVSHNIYLLWSKCLGPIFIWCVYAAMSRRFAHFFLSLSNCVEMWKETFEVWLFFFAKKVRILFVKKQANNLCKSVSPSMVARVSSSLLLWCKCDLKWE